MPISLEVNSVEYTNFTSADVTLALDTLANDFSFDATMPAGEQLPFKGGDPCRVIVDGEVVLTGYIETISGSYSAGNHTITATGRDKTADLIDSHIDVMDDIRAPVTLKQIIEKVIEHIGADIEVVDDANPERFNKAEDIVAPKPGDNCFDFIEGYAQKRQVLLTSNADGNIVITNSQPFPGGGLIQNVVKGRDNNVIQASWTTDTVNLYRKYIQKGQLDPVALDFGDATSQDGVISQDSGIEDERIREGRQLVTVAAKGFSKEQLQSRAEWSKKIRQARSTVYSSTVQGFQNVDEGLWEINTTAFIVDEFADINRELLINTISFTYNSSGSVTTLGFVEANAYELLVNEPKPVGTNQDAFSL